MIAKIGSRGLGAARGFARPEHDPYPTDEKIGKTLLHCEAFPSRERIWEPACGDGALAKLLVSAGHRVVATDIEKYDYADRRQDFLETTSLPRGVTSIVTNPPFKQWQAFAKHAIDLAPTNKVVLLGRLLMLEGVSRSRFFRETQLTRVHIVGRGKMLPKGAVDKGHSGMICFAWFVWDLQIYRFSPTIHWHYGDTK